MDQPKSILAEQLALWARLGLLYLPRPRSAVGVEPTEAADKLVEQLFSESCAGVKSLTALPPEGDLFSRDDETWSDLAACLAEAVSCTKCELSRTRTNVVFGEGDSGARLMFVGEAPGADEDAQGLPFVGRAGKLLDKMITAMGLKRGEVYIANILKCRPPGNRDPLPTEVTACRPYLEAQIELIAPEFVCCLGRHAATRLLGRDEPLSRLRGAIHRYNERTRMVVTYHPAYCLRNPASKRDVWQDLQVIMRELGLKPPRR
ncbi:uracil-DNA glycosylase [bacterium]|nr:uracil-DNA glycosylase [bacterium]